MMRARAALAAWALSACLLPAPADDPRDTLAGRSSVAHFADRDRQLAEIAVTEADALSDRLSHDLGIELEGRADITICSSHEEFTAETGTEYGSWVRGVAAPSRNRVVLKALPEGVFRRVVRHEIAHLFIGRMLGEAEAGAPRWLHEGAAKYYADDWSSGDSETLAAAARGGELKRISELRSFPTDPAQSSVAYAQSYVLVEYLVSQGGEGSLGEFIDQYATTGDVFRAALRTYGMSEAEFERGFRTAVLARAGRVRRPWTVEATVFAAMVVIFAFGYWRVRRRSLEIRERMEQEELLEGLMEGVPFTRISEDELLEGRDQGEEEDSSAGTS